MIVQHSSTMASVNCKTLRGTGCNHSNSTYGSYYTAKAVSKSPKHNLNKMLNKISTCSIYCQAVCVELHCTGVHVMVSLTCGGDLTVQRLN